MPSCVFVYCACGVLAVGHTRTSAVAYCFFSSPRQSAHVAPIAVHALSEAQNSLLVWGKTGKMNVFVRQSICRCL